MYEIEPLCHFNNEPLHLIIYFNNNVDVFLSLKFLFNLKYFKSLIRRSAFIPSCENNIVATMEWLGAKVYFL
jgi:hypothetical protein